MKKRVICHYKNGALLFRTIGSFERNRACEIMELFIKRNLVSALKPRGNNLYQVVGRLNVCYDPFEKTSIKWEEVLQKMNTTKQQLDKDLQPFYFNNLGVTPGRYFNMRR
jgi:c-di-GMP-related signal transduction protein